jgi:hypothetical protein
MSPDFWRMKKVSGTIPRGQFVTAAIPIIMQNQTAQPESVSAVIATAVHLIEREGSDNEKSQNILSVFLCYPCVGACLPGMQPA